MRELRYFGGIALALAVATLAATAEHAAGAADAPRQAVVTVKGLACPFCVYGLEKHLRKLSGATTVHVDLGRGQAIIDFDADSKVTDEAIRRAVKDAGFTVDKIQWRGVASDSRQAPTRIVALLVNRRNSRVASISGSLIVEADPLLAAKS
jgi:mercuric ion binding protein